MTDPEGTASAPLFDRAPGALLFYRPAGPVTARAFLADVRRLAPRLPPGRFLVILCRDRYAFALAFAAALVEGRTALLNVDPARLANLAAAYPGATPIDDDAVQAALHAQPGPLPDAAVPTIPCDHLAAIVFTSGSTGAPVAHPKRWGALVQRSRALQSMFGIAGGTVLGTVPPQHMYGFETTVLAPLHADLASWCGDAFFPGDVAAAVAACAGPRGLVTTPLHLRNLLQSGVVLDLAAVVSATAPLDPAMAAAAEATWSTCVLEIFGATECGSIAWRQTTAGPDWTAYPGVEIAFEDGGALVAAPYADTVRLADVLEPAPAGFRLLGRRTDVVKLGGRRASLPGLDRMLQGVAGVADGVFVVPEEADGRLIAIVVAPGRTAAAILADLRAVMEPIFLPRRVIQVEKLPRNALGKLPRQDLLALIASA